MLDVRGGQPQRLDLAQLPIDRFRRDELAQVLEGAVHALGAAALPLVGGGGDGWRRLLMGVVGYSCPPVNLQTDNWRRGLRVRVVVKAEKCRIANTIHWNQGWAKSIGSTSNLLLSICVYACTRTLVQYTCIFLVTFPKCLLQL